MKKSLKILMAVFALCMSFIFINADSVDAAASSKISTQAYKASYLTIYGYSKSGTTVNVKRMNEDQVGVIVRMYAKNNKLIAHKTVKFNGKSNIKVTLSKGMTLNNYYTFNVQAFYKKASGKIYYGGVSAKRGFGLFRPYCSGTISKTTGVCCENIRMPKAAGVKYFELWISTTSQRKGYKKIMTVQPGKTVSLTKVNGKAIRAYGRGHNFYTYIRPVLNSGVKAIYHPDYIVAFSFRF